MSGSIHQIHPQYGQAFWQSRRKKYSECQRQSHQRPHVTQYACFFPPQFKVFENRAQEMRGLTAENNPSLITTRYFLQGDWCPAHYQVHCTTGMLLKVLGSFCGHQGFNKHWPKHWGDVCLKANSFLQCLIFENSAAFISAILCVLLSIYAVPASYTELI